jgi:hypothetical protein
MDIHPMTYNHNIAQVVSQAAIHLHNALGSIGTALFDRCGTMIFNNNALKYMNENTLAELIALSLANAQSFGNDYVTHDGIHVRVIALDSDHIFVVAGNSLESNTLNTFVTNLKRVLPKTPRAIL